MRFWDKGEPRGVRALLMFLEACSRIRKGRELGTPRAKTVRVQPAAQRRERQRATVWAWPEQKDARTRSQAHARHVHLRPPLAATAAAPVALTT